MVRWREDHATLTVTRRWKGAPTDTVTVHTPSDGTMCGFGLQAGARVLIFATEDSLHSLATSKCTPSRAWGPDADHLARLLGRPLMHR